MIASHFFQRTLCSVHHSFVVDVAKLFQADKHIFDLRSSDKNKRAVMVIMKDFITQYSVACELWSFEKS